jgi:hypothetical protein
MLRLAVAMLVVAGPSAAAQATVDGVVYDSISRGPLAGARVQFYGPTDSSNARVLAATTDARGEFRITGLARGRYLAGFFHPSLDSLGLDMPSQIVDVTSDRHTQLATPSPSSLSRTLCSGKSLGDSTAVLIGHLRESGTGRALANARVHVDWRETTINKKTISSIGVIATSETTGPGWFAVCGVPSSAPLIVRAELAGDTTGDVQVELPPGGLSHITLHLATSAGSGGGISRRRNDVRVVGAVLDGAGRPMVANVSAWGTVANAMTDERGQYRLDSLPAGTRTLEFRSIGAEPTFVVTDVVRDQPNRVDVTMQKAVALKAVEIRATVAYSRGLELFERHQRRSAGGVFIRALDGAAAGQDLIALTRRAFGVNVTFDIRDRRWHAYMRKPGASLRTGPAQCEPKLYLDGLKALEEFDDLANYLGPDMILALEIYPNYGEIPSDYPTEPLSPCGLISIWTRPLEMRPAKP